MNKQMEAERQRLGAAIARYRVRKGLSCSKLYNALDKVLDHEHKLGNEAAVTRLEQGKLVKISHQLVEALSLVLDCTDDERAGLLLLAGQNILLEVSGEITPMMESYNRVMANLRPDVYKLAERLAGFQALDTLPQKDVDELVLLALETILAYRLREKKLPQ